MSFSTDKPPGQPVIPKFEKELQEKVFSMLTSKSGFKSRRVTFCGAQPVSFVSSHLKLLEEEDYYVCEKSDGTRYMMYFSETRLGPAVYLIGRKFNFRYLSLFFPRVDNPKKNQLETLIDGELVVDTDPVSGKQRLRYLAYDLMYINGKNIMQENLNKRLGYLGKHVHHPLRDYLIANAEANQKMPFSFEMKRMEFSYSLPQVFDSIKNLKHENDGLVFTPINYPYEPGTCEKLLKWKSADMNSVDFKISILSRGGKCIYELWAAKSGNPIFYDYLDVEPEYEQVWKESPPNQKIGEFRHDPTWHTTSYDEQGQPNVRVGGWRFMRFREDKDLPNDERVVKKIIKSIEDGVTQQQLLVIVDNIKRNWKQREEARRHPSTNQQSNVVTRKRALDGGSDGNHNSKKIREES